MDIAVLTSSRADFGFYKTLIDELKKFKKHRVKLIVFGTHLSHKHGYTVSYIKEQGYSIYKEIQTVINGDSPKIITHTIAKTTKKFADFWNNNRFDLIICLGDRYEMFAAVSASVPFNIPIAHISGGEETLGAIDNIYRHSLSLMAKYHFTNTKKNAQRVKALIGSDKNIYFTGSLAIDNIKTTQLLTKKQFKNRFKIDISQPFILLTFHPETVDYKKNSAYAKILGKILLKSKVNILVTMPNADTASSEIRKVIIEVAQKNNNIKTVESLGSEGYYTALKYCLFVMGNSSSGIVEAASFSKYVLNIGDRQKGREKGDNVIDVKIIEKEIISAMNKIHTLPKLNTKNIYGNGTAAKKIVEVVNKITS